MGDGLSVITVLAHAVTPAEEPAEANHTTPLATKRYCNLDIPKPYIL